MEPFLSQKQELDIHKYLAHLTWTRTNIDAKPWTIDGLMGIALKHGLEFLGLIDQSFPFSNDAIHQEVRGVRDASAMIIESLFQSHEESSGEAAT